MTKTTTAKTTRRSAKITTKPYTPAALTRVYDKATGVCLGYLAPSRDNKETYQVTCDENAIWHCTCKATVENCCHVKAAKELCEIRVKQGRPACHAASLPEITDEQMAAIAAEAHRVADEPAIVGSVAEHIAVEKQGLDDVVLTEDEEAENRRIRAANKAAEDAAIKRFAEQSRDLIAVAANQAAKAGDAVDVLIASAAQSERRMAAPINGSRRIGIAPIVAPVLAVGRVVPMR